MKQEFSEMVTNFSLCFGNTRPDFLNRLHKTVIDYDYLLFLKPDYKYASVFETYIIIAFLDT